MKETNAKSRYLGARPLVFIRRIQFIFVLRRNRPEPSTPPQAFMNNFNIEFFMSQEFKIHVKTQAELL